MDAPTVSTRFDFNQVTAVTNNVSFQLAGHQMSALQIWREKPLHFEVPISTAYVGTKALGDWKWPVEFAGFAEFGALGR